MITLKQLQKVVNAYLMLHGDKELLSVATYNGSSSVGFELQLCDIFEGPIGHDPFTGRDSIKLYKDGQTAYDQAAELNDSNNMEK